MTIDPHNFKPGELLDMVKDIDQVQMENGRYSDLCHLFWMAVENDPSLAELTPQYYDFGDLGASDVVEKIMKERVQYLADLIDTEYNAARVGTDKIMLLTANFNIFASNMPGQMAPAFEQDLRQQSTDVGTMSVMADSQIKVINNNDDDYLDDSRKADLEYRRDLMIDNAKNLQKMFDDKSFADADDRDFAECMAAYKDFNAQLATIGFMLVDQSLDLAENSLTSVLMMNVLFQATNPESQFYGAKAQELMDAEVCLQRIAILHTRSKKIQELNSKLDFS
jgi:hypothetical protein